MKISRIEICKNVFDHCQTDSCRSTDINPVVGWRELADFLGITVKAVQVDLAKNPLWLAQDKSNLKLVMVSEPPDEFAILQTSASEVLDYRDRVDVPEIWILTVEEYASLRKLGSVRWLRFVDLKARFPDLDDVFDGELGLDKRTNARFFPVCIDRDWLAVRSRLRGYVVSVERSIAVSKRWSQSESTAHQDGPFRFNGRSHTMEIQSPKRGISDVI